MDYFASYDFVSDHLVPLLSTLDLGRLLCVSKKFHSAVEREIESRRERVRPLAMDLEGVLSEPIVGCANADCIKAIRCIVEKTKVLMGPEDCPFFPNEWRTALTMLPDCFYSVIPMLTLEDEFIAAFHMNNEDFMTLLNAILDICMQQMNNKENWPVDYIVGIFNMFPPFATSLFRRQARKIVENEPLAKDMFETILNEMVARREGDDEEQKVK